MRVCVCVTRRELLANLHVNGTTTARARIRAGRKRRRLPVLLLCGGGYRIARGNFSFFFFFRGTKDIIRYRARAVRESEYYILRRKSLSVCV